MKVRIGKEFVWEMSHRLTFHKGPCVNIHGHTYKMVVELVGDTDQNGMILDFYDLEKIVRPLINQIDHAFICDEKDDLMIDFLNANNFKYFVIANFSTAENMSKHFLEIFLPDFAKFQNIDSIKVRVYETADAWAEVEKNIR